MTDPPRDRIESGPGKAPTASEYKRLLRFLATRVSDEQDVKDLAQEAYLRLIRAMDSRLIDDPAAYLFRIAANLLYEWYKSSPPPCASLDEIELVDEGMSVEQLAALSQHMERLDGVLRQLAPNWRAAILMHRRDGMTYNEIAGALDVSPSTVKKYLSLGLARCRASLRAMYER